MHFAFRNDAVDNFRVNFLLADIFHVAPELRNAAEIFQKFRVRLVDSMKIFEIFESVFHETQLRKRFAVLAFGAFNRVAQRIVAVNFNAVRLQNFQHLAEIKILYRRRAENDDIFVVELFQPPANVIQNPIDGLFNLRRIAFVDSIHRDKKRIKFVVFRKSFVNLIEIFDFVISQMVGIIHDENANIGGFYTFFGDFLVLFACACEIRTRRIPNFIAVKPVARIMNDHVGELGALASVLQRFFKFCVNEIFQFFRSAESQSPAVIIHRQTGVG